MDEGIQGIRTGQSLTVNEWAGLWQAGDRYRPGQRMVLFLHRPSSRGLTSPVGGANGRYSVDRNGTILLDASRLPGPRLGPRSPRPSEHFSPSESPVMTSPAPSCWRDGSKYAEASV